jgi:hypothetical protein
LTVSDVDPETACASIGCVLRVMRRQRSGVKQSLIEAPFDAARAPRAGLYLLPCDVSIR